MKTCKLRRDDFLFDYYTNSKKYYQVMDLVKKRTALIDKHSFLV